MGAYQGHYGNWNLIYNISGCNKEVAAFLIHMQTITKLFADTQGLTKPAL